MRKYIFFFILFFFINIVNNLAQDIRFSQIDLNLKSTFAAPTEYDKEAFLAYRAQWLGVASFRNMLASYHQPINDFTLGAKLMQHDAGKKSLKTTQFLADINYRKILNRWDDYIAFGASIGLIQQRFQTEMFKFDQQYTEGQGFDEGIAHGEQFERTASLMPVLHAGIYGKKHFENFSIRAALNVNNINQPVTGFMEGNVTDFSRTLNSYIGVEIPWEDTWLWNAYLMYHRSAIYQEPLLGVRANYSYDDDYTLILGLANRSMDRFVFELGFSTQPFTFILSYDFWYKNFPPVNGNIGTFELTARYQLLD